MQLSRPSRLTLTTLLAAAATFGCSEDNESAASADSGVRVDIGTDAEVPSRNRRPSLSRIGRKEIIVGQTLEIQLEGADPDGQALTFSVRSNLPAGAKFDKQTALFSWTPTADQQGTTFQITFEVSDGSLKDQETVGISVLAMAQAMNQAPTLEPIGDQALTAGSPFSLTVVATDVNGDSITYSAQMAPEGAAIDAGTGAFSWTPTVAQAGNHEIIFIASDGQLESSASVNFVVATEQGGENTPPTFDPIDNQILRIGEPFSLTVRAEDDTPEALVYGIQGDIPAGSAFDVESATFTWTPTPDQGGRAFDVSFTVSDGTFRALVRGRFQIEPEVVECVPDALEADEPGILVSGTVDQGRSVCPMGDTDAFLFSAEAGWGISLRAAFSHVAGDVDMLLIGPSGGEWLADSSDDDELLTLRAPETGDYEVRIFGRDATQPSYSLSLDLEERAALCMDDAFDADGGNDTPQRASALAATEDQQLMICSGDADFYTTDLVAGARLTVLAAFRHADGDLDMRITGPEGTTARSTSSTDDEIIALIAPADGPYIVEIFGFQGASNRYEMTSEIVAPAACEADALEPNDTPQTPSVLAVGQQANLRTCGEPDWYRAEAPAGQALKITVSYDGEAPVEVEAFSADGGPRGGQALVVGDGGACSVARAGCRVLTVFSEGAPILWRVRGAVGQGYDMTVAIDDAAVACGPQTQICAEDQLCNYQSRQCDSVFCDTDRDCPDDYLCHEQWCVELCTDALDCNNPRLQCKLLQGVELCGAEGPAETGAACADFSDCNGSLDCLQDAPGGYCSRECTGEDNACGLGQCATWNDGNFCAATCDGGGCREGYECAERPLAIGGTAQICVPL